MPSPAHAGKFTFIERLLKKSDDVAKFGSKSKIAFKDADKISIIKKYPSLTKASEDLIKGVYQIERIAAKTPAAARMIEAGANPARVAALASRTPDTVKAGEKIAELFAKNPMSSIGDGFKKLPPQAASAMRQINGDYAKTAELFIKMEQRGGAKATEIAKKLFSYITPGTVAGASAAALLAWHMADPEGSEQAIEEFFHDHVAPVVIAPAKGLVNAAGDATEEVLETTTLRIMNIAQQHWGWLIAGCLALLCWLVPNLWRLPFNALNAYIGNINKKFADRDAPLLTNKKETTRARPMATTIQPNRRINVYKK